MGRLAQPEWRRALARARRRNPGIDPRAAAIAEREFPIGAGYWMFEVCKGNRTKGRPYGYLAPPHVGIEPLSGEVVVPITADPVEDPDVEQDMTGWHAIFTERPIPVEQVITFDLYPDFYTLPTFVVEALGGQEMVELVDESGRVALIHLDTHPPENRTHRGQVFAHRVTFFDEYGPSGHRNGTFEELLKDALQSGYRRIEPGALDRIEFKELPVRTPGHV